jgi:hypothetical protein
LKIKSTKDSSDHTGGTGALQCLGGASIAKNLYVGGNLEVEGFTSGTITEINSESLVIKDPLIQIGTAADSGALTGVDAFDRGLVMNWWDATGSVQKLGAIVLDANDQKFMLTKVGTLATNAITTTTYGDIKLGNIEGLEATMKIDSKVGDMTVITSGTNANINITANGTGEIKTSGHILPQEATNTYGDTSHYFAQGWALKTYWNNTCNFDGTASGTTSVIMTGDYNLAANSTLEATYADLGERFASDDIYEPGTVVKLGGLEEITKTMEEEDTDVFGIISAKPGLGLNGGAGPKETHPHVAMTGRIPCKVIGPVKKGDRLCSSEIPGVAKKADIESVSSFAIIGRALEDFNEEGEGTVLVVVGPIN